MIGILAPVQQLAGPKVPENGLHVVNCRVAVGAAVVTEAIGDIEQS